MANKDITKEGSCIVEGWKMWKDFRGESSSSENEAECPKQTLEPPTEDDMSKDIGIRAIDYVYSTMQIDDEWSVRSDREFTWWGCTLSQRVWAEPLREIMKAPAVLLNARMKLSFQVEESDELYQTLSMFNAHATLGALAYDPVRSEVFYHSSVMIHDQIERWMQAIFLHTVAIQAADGFIKSGDFLMNYYWPSPISVHPFSGPRDRADGMLKVLQDVYVPTGTKASPWHQKEFELVRQKGDILAVLATSGEEGLTAEFPYSGSAPAVLLLVKKEPLQTALLQVRTNQPHPRMGNGCLMTLTLPIDSEDPRLANELNLAEARGDSNCHLLGAWCIGPMGLTFVTFIPNACYTPGLLDLLFQRNALRVDWAKRFIENIDKV